MVMVVMALSSLCRYVWGEEDCDNRCPTVDLVAHPFDKPSDAPRSEDAGAHLFIVGDSTNKLLHMSFCNQVGTWGAYVICLFIPLSDDCVHCILYKARTNAQDGNRVNCNVCDCGII
jgi:hypothetical protein